MEADLSRYHQLDYRDRWRFDELGRRRLTLRMISVRVRTLPAGSALRTALNDGRPEWGDTEYLLADVWQASAGSKKPHPARPKPAGPQQDNSRRRQQAIAKARRKAAERRRGALLAVQAPEPPAG